MVSQAKLLLAQILHSAIYSEMNTAPITKKAVLKRKGVVISLCFLWKLLLFTVKRFYNLLYNPTCGK